MDRHGNTLLANKAIYKQYGVTRKKFEKEYSSTEQLIASGILDRSDYRLVVERKKPVREWMWMKSTDGTTKQYYAEKQPVFDAFGEVKYVIGWVISKDRLSKAYRELSDWPLPSSISGKTPLIYGSEQMERIVRILNNTMHSDVPILLTGETGTGKEVLANYIHDHSERRGRKMVVINCAAIPAALFESEMFGYVGGSFTGGDAEGRMGVIEAADQSTLFLDEVNSLPLEAQGKLLRTLDTKVIQRIGSRTPTKVDFKLIAATNRDLLEMVEKGEFRSDLYYRLNMINAEIPPLRERKKDIRLLADVFLKQCNERYSLQRYLTESIYRSLEEYAWPGNVRELKYLINRAVLLSRDDELELIDFAIPEKSCHIKGDTEALVSVVPRGGNLKEAMEACERQILKEAVDSDETLNQIAERLDISLSTLVRKLRKYGYKKKRVIDLERDDVLNKEM